MKSNRFRAAAWPVLALLALTGVAARHMQLTRSAPEADATVAASPAELRLWFSQEPEMAVSRVGLEGPAGAVDLGDLEATDDAKSFKAAVPASLADGEYTVSWRTAGDDGHIVRGRFAFTVDADRDPR